MLLVVQGGYGLTLAFPLSAGDYSDCSILKFLNVDKIVFIIDSYSIE